MIEESSYPSNFPYRLIITHILEACNISLKAIHSVIMKECYNTTDLGSMVYILVYDIWFTKFDSGYIVTPFSPKSRMSPPLVSSSSLLDATIHLIAIYLMINAINDLLLALHFYLDKIKDIHKKIITDAACLRVRLD